MLFNETRYNIPKFYIYAFFSGLIFFFPVYVLFFLGKGFSYMQVLFLDSLIVLIPLLFEIPTGYLADVKGRKFCIVLSSLCLVAGGALLLVGSNFQVFIAAMSLVGLGMALSSGADSAFVYDSLLSLGKKERFASVWGRSRFVFLGSAALASIGGGIAAKSGFQFPIILTIAAFAISLFFAISFREPEREKPIVKGGHIKFVSDIFHFMLSSKQILSAMIYGAFLSPLVLAYQVLVQPLAISFGFSLASLGILYALLLALDGVGGLTASRVLAKLTVSKALTLSAIMGGLSLVFLAYVQSAFALLLLAFPAIAYGLARVAVPAAINKITPSDRRATVLSVNGMVFGLGYTAIALISGKIIDLFSVTPVLIGGGLLAVVGGIFAFTLIPSANKLYK
ncbi:MFS transporter [Candidatus Woesearchaeota archaeon]|nr:MFS transporter [Candidatus Woesearchaeota archaeon]